jgi:nitroreductase
METLDAIMTRKSCRKYLDRQVDEADLRRVLDAGLQAATAAGHQPWKLVVVQDRATRDRLSRMNAAILGKEGIDPFYGAPMVICVLCERDRSCPVEDGSLALGNMMLAAHDLGLGSCWIHRCFEEFESEEGRELLAAWGVEGDWRGIGHLILGYPDGPLHPDVPRRENTVVYVR